MQSELSTVAAVRIEYQYGVLQVYCALYCKKDVLMNTLSSNEVQQVWPLVSLISAQRVVWCEVTGSSDDGQITSGRWRLVW